MRPSLRATLALIAATILLLATALTASAAVSNDTPSDAIPVTLGETYTQGTTGAETEPLDDQLNDECGASFVLGSVWYTYESDGSEDAGILIDASSSDYSVGLMVFEGDPTAGGELVSCGPLMSANPTTEGETYYIMAFTDNDDSAPGGSLSLTVGPVPPAPALSITVDPRATADKTGGVRLTGTYTCTGDAEWSELFGDLTQRVGRVKIVGGFSLSDLSCDGETHPWDAYATSSNGYFAGGKAATLTFAYACGALSCGDGYVEQTIQLSRGKK